MIKDAKDGIEKTLNIQQSPFEVQYDALLEQFGSDMNMYMRMVCDTICVTVPKAIVHCMVRREGGRAAWCVEGLCGCGRVPFDDPWGLATSGWR